MVYHSASRQLLPNAPTGTVYLGKHYLTFIIIVITVLSGNSKSANMPRFPDEQIEESLLCFYKSYTPFLRLHSTALRKYGRNFRGEISGKPCAETARWQDRTALVLEEICLASC
jgi:hypothetical protein